MDRTPSRGRTRGGALWFLRAQLLSLPWSQLPHVPRRRRLRFAARWLRHAAGCLAFLTDACVKPRERPLRQPSTVAILLSCHRPWNMDPIVRVLLKSACIARVVVCNNNPAWSAARIVSVRDERLVLIDRPALTMPGYRFEVARQHPARSYLAVDDDVFLRLTQIRRLAQRFDEHPGNPCGTQGAVYSGAAGPDALCVSRAREWPFRRGTPQDAAVDLLNGVYMFSSDHLEAYFRKCESLSIADQARFGNGEDIVLSHCGVSRPSRIDVGPRLRCMSSGMPGIALSAGDRDAFFAERWRIFRALRCQRPA